MKKPLGALVLHGFCSSLDTVNGLVPHLEGASMPYRLPILRGHGLTPEALKGVHYRDWVEDGAHALNDLLTDADRVIIVGLSMGALVTLTLAVERPECLVGLVLVAPFLYAASPLAPYSHILGAVISRFPMPKPPKHENYQCTNYQWFPTEAFVQTYRFQRSVELRLNEVTQPILILAASRDTIAKPRGANAILAGVGSSSKELRWFGRTGHEMMQGCEKEEVFAAIMTFVRDFGTLPRT